MKHPVGVFKAISSCTALCDVGNGSQTFSFQNSQPAKRPAHLEPSLTLNPVHKVSKK